MKKLKIASLLFVCMGLLAACDESKETKPLVAPVKKIEVYTVVPEDFQQTFVMASAAEAATNYRLSAEVSGVLISKMIARGDQVKKDQVLFELDSEPFLLDLRQKKARSAETEARFVLTQTELKRKKPLFLSKTLSQSGWDQLQFDAASARAANDQAMVALTQAKRALDLTHLKSPLAGQVLETYHELGEVLNPGAIVAWLIDPSQMVFEVGVSDFELRYLHRGDAVFVSIDAFPGQNFTGSISQLAALASPKNGSFPVEVTVENPDNRIVSGMIARLNLAGRLHKDAILIPLVALHQKEGLHFVLVAQGNHAKQRSVEPGLIKGDRIFIKSGLDKGDQVIVLSQGRLLAGDEVELVHQDPADS